MVKILSKDGKKKGGKELPSPFQEPYRPDLIKKAVLTHQSRRRQSYGADRKSGMKTSAHYEGSRHVSPNSQMMNREMSRMPREHGDTARRFRALQAPHAVGGRRAHPPTSEKDFGKKINKKERKKALRSAIAATGKQDPVSERNHRYGGDLPIVFEDGIQEIERTRDLEKVLGSAGLGEELERTEKKIRAGKGTGRGRKYREGKSILIVVCEDEGIGRAGRNLPGVDVAKVENLNAELLSPGAHGARLTAYTESAVEKIGERWSG